MAEHVNANEAASDAPEVRSSRLGRLLGGIVKWTSASRVRMIAAALCGAGCLVAMFATWSLLAHVAVDSLTPVTIASAFEALDQGRYDDARAIIADMQDRPATPDLLSGALVVLGTAKAQEANEESTADRRRALYQVAARYLKQAVERELPSLRRRHAVYLLGKSLVSGGEPEAGIAVLEEALRDPEQPATEIHALLVRAYLNAPDPRLNDALAHNKRVLQDVNAPAFLRNTALIEQADMYVRLKQLEEARKVLDQIATVPSLGAPREFLGGRLEFEKALTLKPASKERNEQLQVAVRRLRRAIQLDGNRGPVSRQSMYWIARCYDAEGDDDLSVAEFERLANIFGDQPEATAATLSLADFRRRTGDFGRALEDYRAVLTAVGDPHTYSNPLLSFTELQARLTAAYQQLVDDDKFSEALGLVELFESAFERDQCIELRGKTLEAWGTWVIDQAKDATGTKAQEERKQGRTHLRAAGHAFEQLAAFHYSTRKYTTDLWTAADCYFRGQSYSGAERILQIYLHEEARKWNALALLRLGQCRLAGREFQRAIATLEECIELFPSDPVAYQARLECARAYQQSGNFERAEELLTSNLTGDTLTPLSHEWRDSLFTLGRLLYETQRYEESIAKLEEAVERYPDADSTLLAKYTIARAFHGAAEEPARRLRDAKTENERQKNRKLLNDYLEGALTAYIEVQRAITLRGQANVDPLSRELLLNCYMMKGSVLYELRRFEEARQAYGNVVTLYENQPIVLESLVQVANCWRRLNQPAKARVTLQRAKLALSRLPPNSNYLASTNFDRQRWELLIDQMSAW